MNAVTLKKELHKKIDGIDDLELLEAVYTILSRPKVKADYSLTQDQMDELDRRLELHDSGEMKYYTVDEVKKKFAARKKK